jgi:hypothetical protein
MVERSIFQRINEVMRVVIEASPSASTGSIRGEGHDGEPHLDLARRAHLRAHHA